jgi:hypothetical protein
MTTEMLRVMVPPTVVPPRGAAWAAVVALGVSIAARSLWLGARGLWRALEAIGERRAANELHRLARQCEAFDPERARLLRDAAGNRHRP